LTSPLRLQSFRDPRDLHSFPTRRSSDLIGFVLGTDYAVNKAVLIEFLPRHVRDRILGSLAIFWAGGYACAYFAAFALDAVSEQSDRKSTRLNSSHRTISYAVFCLKKKTY